MSWRDKVQTMRQRVNSQKCPNHLLPKTTETIFVVSVSTPPAPFQEKKGVPGHPTIHAGIVENLRKPEPAPAVNDRAQAAGLAALATPAPAAMSDPDRWCWPHSSAMTGREIDMMIERTALFNRRGLSALEAELLADKLVNRDRDGDDRRLCMECAYLSRAGTLRCAQWQRAGLGAPGVPAGLQIQLQRCKGFRD